jgi:hypothetical protein
MAILSTTNVLTQELEVVVVPDTADPAFCVGKAGKVPQKVRKIEPVDEETTDLSQPSRLVVQPVAPAAPPAGVLVASSASAVAISWT